MTPYLPSILASRFRHHTVCSESVVRAICATAKAWQQKRLLLLLSVLISTGCAHFGLDAEADIAAENCYAYRYGDKIRAINFMQAFDWCQRAARWGDANSQTLLGELYHLGLGGAQDLAYASEWYGKAARQGHAHAQYMLYRLYAAGPQTRQEAAYWLRQARLGGYKLALQDTHEHAAQ